MSALVGYYRFHSKIYDATRWSFLFGRQGIIRHLQQVSPAPGRILEIGCGTGINLTALARAFPNAQLTGLDLSEDMLTRAAKRVAPLGDRVTLKHQMYDAPLSAGEYDAVLFSYCLTMINPGWEAVLSHAARDLAPQGVIAVMDFHDTPFGFFRRWMGVNHVALNGHLLPALTAQFTPQLAKPCRAYGGVWRYFYFMGTPK